MAREYVYKTLPACGCDPDRLLDGKGHSDCDWLKEMLGEVVGADGRVTGVRRTDALAMLDLSARIENSTVLMYLSGPSQSWAVAINKFLDLFDSPHNVSELWVWRMFQWVFGRDGQSGNTWKAADRLEELTLAADQLHQLSIDWHNRSKLSWLARRKLAKECDRAQLTLFAILGELMTNWVCWPERADFEKFAGKVKL